MTAPVEIRFHEVSLDAIPEAEGRVVVFLPESGKLDQTARRVNRLMRGALERFAESKAYNDLKLCEAHELAFPTGMSAESIIVVKLERKASAAEARRAGAAIGKARNGRPLLVLAGTVQRPAEVAFGLALRAYEFTAHKTGDQISEAPVTMMVAKPEAVAAEAQDMLARAEGVFFARDLVSEPSNVLTTEDFAARLAAMRDLGLEVEILDEPELERLGMRTLLAVGRGSESPSKVVVMRWSGGGAEKPLALVGKGVVFDTGGISLKPAQGMEDMTMDMGGAAVVAGTMRALALRKAKANVVGLVGLVENMPDGRAMRPGDVVTSMKGDTVEIINTDAEGRLVLADVLWYAQDRFEPTGLIDLATLTGAVIIALGHERAGVFSNNDALATAFLNAADAEEEGAWRLPLGKAYETALKSRIADIKNVGDRAAGSITAAQFLQRFVRDDMPWVHLDIAGVASTKRDTDFAPKGATGWGVLALDRLIRDRYET
jgi:leucyl aminopeptidase